MKKITRSFAAVSVAGLLALAACNSDSPSSSDGLAPGGEPAPVSGTFRINPDTIVAEGGAQIQFVALDSAADGVVRPAAATWSAASGTIDSTGLYVAPTSAGKYQVTGRSADGTVATSTVSVEADAPQQVAHAVSTSFWVEITPGSVTLSPGQTTQFSAVIKTSDNKSLSMRTVWQATGGSISTTGQYTAPSQAGTYRVVAIREGDSMADTAQVTVSGSSSTPTTPPPTSPSPAPTEEAKYRAFWIEVTPATVSLAPGAAQQFSAIGKTIFGYSYSVRVNWTASGGSISSTGRYTAPSSAGTYRVIAVRQGDVQADTSFITVGSGGSTPPPTAPTLSRIELTPATVSLVTGATQQFSVIGRRTDNSTVAVTATYSATGGTINSSGLYTAGSTTGTFRVIAVQSGATRADTTAVTITAGTPSTPTTPPPSTSGRPNPQGLPLAASGSGSVAPNMATVAALQSATAAGGTYTDPYTGVTVLKLTSSSLPSSGSHEHGYAEGGFRISQSFMVGGERYSSILTGDGYISDIRHRDMAVTRRVRLTISMSGEIGAAFSANPATPRILYVVSNGGSPATVNRYDTQTMTLANTGSFPWRPTRPSGASGDLNWFQTQYNDTWMTAQWGGSGATAIHAFRPADGFSRYLVVSADEHHLDKKLGYVYLVNRPTPVWRLSDGATFQANDPGNHIATDHSGTVGGALVGAAFWQGGGGAYYYRPDVNQTFWFITSDANFHSASNDWYNAGHWCVDQPSDVVSEQWFVADRFLGDDSQAKIRRGMIAFVRLNGEVRLLAAHGSAATSYQSYPQTHPAIDGRLVMWTSDMNGSGQYQVFVARVPVS